MQMSACFSLAAAGPMSTRPQMATKPVAVQMLGFKKDAAVESAESPLASILAPVETLLDETSESIQTAWEESSLAEIWEEGTGNDFIDYFLSIPQYFARNGGFYW